MKKTLLLSAALAAVLLPLPIMIAHAQTETGGVDSRAANTRAARRAKEGGTKQAPMYPQTKREEPKQSGNTALTKQLAALDAAYKFTGTPNAEIAQRWYPLAIRSGYTKADAAIAAFLQKIGRRKLIMPTYNALVQTPEGLKLAEDTFAKAKPGYHPITTGSVQHVIDEAKAKSAQPAQ